MVSYWHMKSTRHPTVICNKFFLLKPHSHMSVIFSPDCLNSIWYSFVPQVTMWRWQRSMEHWWWHSNTVSTVRASIQVGWSFGICSTFPVSRREWPSLEEGYTLPILVIKISTDFSCVSFFFCSALQIWLLSTALSVRNMASLTRTSGSVSGAHMLALSPPGSGERW